VLVRTSLRSKLQRATLGIWLLVSAVTLGGVAVAQYRDSAESAARNARGLREMLQEKSRLLLANQALALRGMALENAFSDVQQLVHRTVSSDPDLVYGIYTDAENSVWAFLGPGMPESGLHSKQAELAWEHQHLSDDRQPSLETQTRTVVAFGRQLQERRADVYDGSDYLGTVRYGFSTLRTDLTVQRELARARRALWKTLALVAGLGIAGLVLGAFAIRRAARRITLPLAELSRASTEIAQGNRSCRANVTSGDELENLANAFNLMAEVTEATMRELEVKTAEALAASRLKSEFLANMSHEIRTPMNGILGVGRLMQRLSLEGKARRYVETIDSSASALLTIINDVLDFSKMEAGKYTLQEIPFDMHTVVQEVVELLAPRAHEKGLEILHRISPDVSPLVRGDPDRTRQVLNNLVGNALKFTDTGEVVVEVSAEPSARHDVQLIQVVVRDTGIGIDEADMGKLFDAFSQVDGSMVRKFGGTGLGLAISRHLVQLMGGTMGVRSQPGKGSEFWFKVPLPQEPQPPPSANHAWVDGRTLLLVEPHEGWRRAILEHCADWGFSVVSYDCGRAALASVARGPGEKPSDVAVISSQLTDIGFEDLVRELRNGAPKHMPIVALYPLGLGANLGEIEKVLAAQLPKPLRYSELYETLQRVVVGKNSSHSQIRASESLPLRRDRPVLVVDDNEVNRLVAAETLESIGYRVALAENGAEAIQMIKKQDYLLVLMDCQMPVMDGYAATRAVREWERQVGRHTTIVALTAHALSGEKERVLAAGMDDYLTKPVRASSLDKMIRRYVSSPPQAEGASVTVAAAEATLSTGVSRSRRLVELFLKHVPIQINDMERAVREQNPLELRARAHKTKGSCLAFGAPLMADTSQRLQKLAELGNLEEAPELVVLLRQQFEDVLSALRNSPTAD